MLYPLQFEANLFPVVWGGHRLKEIKGMLPDNEPIGESWEISAVPGKESIVSNGILRGKSLRELTLEYGAALLGQSVLDRYGKDFPLLFKLIDAERDLSIQVHPNDELAQKRHGCMGKTEMWYVVDARLDTYLYVGFAKNISKEEYCSRVEDGSICDVLAKYNIHQGDAFFIPAGCVHSICGGALIAEIQQSSDITYRIYDYGRLGMDGKPRELHTELAVDALDYTMHPEYVLGYQMEKNSPNVICRCDSFEVRRLTLDIPVNRRMKHHDTFVIYMCLQGECVLDNTVQLRRGQSCLVPAMCAEDIVLAPTTDGSPAELLEIFIPQR